MSKGWEELFGRGWVEVDADVEGFIFMLEGGGGVCGCDAGSAMLMEENSQSCVV